ncbi:MAG TPA: 50S ribosomal protein L11 methyltransferase [Armatimonadota bacterium]|jgi:ribosomal protein L11 methyltransferase
MSDAIPQWYALQFTVPAEWEELVSDWLVELSGRGVMGRTAGARAEVTAYCADPVLAEQVIAGAQERWQLLCADCGLEDTLTVTRSTIQEEDWAHAWKAYYHPIRIGRRVVIKPSWETWPPADQPEAAHPDDLVIELDPQMAFGTGTHETTQLCLEALEEFLSPDATVVDIGAGSGILSIAAAQFGAGRVEGWEIDPVAARVAIENFRRNAVDHLCEVHTGEALQELAGTYDLVIANVHTPFLLRLIPELARFLNAGGHVILAGASETSAPALRDAVAAAGLQVLRQTQKGEWVALVIAHPSPKT